jgi:hypothetical protein
MPPTCQCMRSFGAGAATATIAPDSLTQASTLALPMTHSLPPHDNPFLFIVRPGATGTWGERCGYEDWRVNEAHFPPSFQDCLKSVHRGVHSTEKDPPNLPLLTWDKEVEARQAREDARATPLKSPDTHRPLKKARIPGPAATNAPSNQQPAGVTPAAAATQSASPTTPL